MKKSQKSTKSKFRQKGNKGNDPEPLFKQVSGSSGVNHLKFDAKNPRHIVVVSDIHCGCQMALCPPDGAEQDGGGMYMPSKFQTALYNLWRHFWDKDVPRLTEGEPYDIVINGECIDGVHHNSVTQWSQNLTDQMKASVKLLMPEVKKCKGRLFVIRGTEAHCGKSGQYDEEVAKQLGAVPSSSGQYSRYELWKNLGNGLIHFTHHIGATGSSAYESTAVYKELVEAYVEAGRWNQRAPDCVVRSHRHRHFNVEVATGNGKALSIVTPGWQGKTPFVHKIAGGRSTQPQFGGVVLSWSRSEGFIYERHSVWRLERDAAE